MEFGLWPLFVVGLLGGVHCVGMCGGIVGALSAGGARPALHLAYNLGRIASYGLAGALAGALGGTGAVLAGQWPARLLLFVLANLLLIGLGLYLAGWSRLLAPLEKTGNHLWRRIQPVTRRFLPAQTARQALALGALWGWLPCGLVYSALATALASGSAEQGALVMLAFGLGTLPNLLLAGLLATRLAALTRLPAIRFVAGMLVAGYGLYGLFGAWRLVLIG